MKKMMMACFSICLLFIVVACSSGNSDTTSNEGSTGDQEDENQSSSVDEITIWAWDPNFNIAALELAKDTYAEENADVNINIVESAQDDIIQRLNTILSSGSTSGLPHIVLIEDYRAQGFLQSYPDSFHEITGAYELDNFAPYKIAPTSIDDANYGLPFDTGVAGLYVRTDYFEEAGYSVEDLQSLDWNEYIEIGKEIKEATGKYLLTLEPNNLSQLRMMIQTNGGWYVEEDGVTPYLADNEDLKIAFEVYKTLIDEDLAKPISDWSQFVAGFNSGEVASVPTGNWITPSVTAEESQSGDWAVVPFPTLPGVESSIPATNLGGSSWYVLNIDGKEDATDFLAKTFGSNDQLYEDLLNEIGAIGTYLPASQNDAYQSEVEFFGNQSIYADFAKWSELIPQVNYGIHTYSIEDILVVEMQNYLNGKDIDQALQDAQVQAETQIR
ncbi:ABC transporter substrate-binding protein [Alkalihalobacillus trypoxylicola]|uniref:ABC transporter substrate-binding protein n=1 Tax=Alkalihalobacillus trypoxylicola TaxID=519424 RepID=A0A161PG65_9BACI|nr:ABC transporter substrate-binding protein [Alkalihalobacillus trypoxylicola]KYG27692.1 ABC transporter substrate-binding protein [Alkalihalobacillus trypoxylicola]